MGRSSERVAVTVNVWRNGSKLFAPHPEVGVEIRRVITEGDLI
jgi:hypothetical protein